ncbi:MAG: exo-alpha-sialidase [Planctomycetota bacterium]
MGVVAIVGTVKGAFVLRSDSGRKSWKIEGPIFKGWKVTAAAQDPQGNHIWATASDVYGAALQRSKDLENWQQIENGPKYPEGGERKLKEIWRVVCEGDTFYAGVDEAGLFRSADGGEKWEPVPALNDHPTRSAWFPGNGGLCALSVIIDPKNPQRLWCGISAVGVFRSDDGGASWSCKNDGVKVIIEDKEHKDIGYCVHALAHDPDDANRIWRQEHTGMYRTTDGADTWQAIENGLPSGFGFPIVIDRNTKDIYAVPLEKDEYRFPIEGKLKVYRSRNAGDSWEPLSKGLPQERFYAGVLRSAMAVDNGSPSGVYVGTTAGTVHVSNDGGESWQTLPCTLPRILCMSTFQEN